MSRLIAVITTAVIACRSDRAPPPQKQTPPPPVAPLPDPYADARRDMVASTLAARGITDRKVLEAMRLIPRHEFVPPEVRGEAYEDRPLPIGFGSTISQPYIVATMTAAAHIKAGDTVLEIGTGSGYQAAVLAELGCKVYTIEIHDELAARTRKVLDQLGFRDIQLRVADGYYGWKEAAPFDAIIITTAAPTIPPPLLEQLRVGGRMVLPLGDFDQRLVALTKTASSTTEEELMEVRFGSMVGAVQQLHPPDDPDPL